MIAIISLLVIIFLSIIITRVATIALTHTGLSREAARFQARSAFTGAGFTTQESEMVGTHPIRRRIVLLLMLLGNAGIVTAMSSLILSFVSQDGATGLPLKIVLLVTGLVVLWGIASSHWVDKRLSKIIDKALNRFTDLEVKDYASLLHLAGDYRLVELRVNPEDWLASKTMSDARLKDEGIIALGIERPDGSFTGTPEGQTLIRAGDVLVVYGRTDSLKDLDQREKGIEGDIKHENAMDEQEKFEKKEESGANTDK